jgi:hypothetical protein
MLREIDWEKIEKNYRLGQKTTRAIGAEHGISHTAVQKRAKKYGWVQDKSLEVLEKTRAALLAQNKVSKPVAAPTENDINIAVETNVAIILSHRKSIAKLQKVEEKLISELSNKPTKLYIAQYQGLIIEKEIGLTIAEKAQAANNLASVQKHRITLERQAFGLDKIDQPTGDPISDLLTEVVKRARPLFSAKNE